jgi:hypothetical protein
MCIFVERGTRGGLCEKAHRGGDQTKDVSAPVHDGSIELLGAINCVSSGMLSMSILSYFIYQVLSMATSTASW